MGRRSRLKKERRRIEAVADAVDDRIELVPGIEMVSRGRFIETINRQTPEEFEAFTSAIAADAKVIPGRINQQVQELRELIARLPLRETVASLVASRYLADPETFKEYEVPPYLAAEYLVWLYLTNPDPPTTDAGPADPGDVQQVLDRIDELVRATQWRIATDHLRRGHNPPDPLDQLLAATRLEHLLVRGPAYPHHLEAQLRELFTPFADILRRAVGFDIDDGLAICRAIQTTVSDRLLGLQKELKQTTDRWLAALASGDPTDVDLSEHQVLSNIQCSAADPAFAVRAVLVRWFFGTVQEAFTVDRQTIAAASGKDDAAVASYLTRFSLTLQHRPIADSFPSVYEPQMHAPLVHLGDGRWFGPLLPHLWWALKPSLEAAIQAAGPADWDSYDRARAKYVERRAGDLIASVSPHASKWQSLRYEFDAGEGFAEYELDGLVVIDQTAFLIEAKAGVMGDAARRGATESLLDDLSELVGYAYEQARRAERFIESAPEVTFRCEDGSRVRIRRAEWRRVFLVSATLDQLSAFVTRGEELRRLGLLPVDGNVWSVCLADLEVVCDMVEGAGELVHYLQRRQELEPLNVGGRAIW